MSHKGQQNCSLRRSNVSAVLLLSPALKRGVQGGYPAWQDSPSDLPAEIFEPSEIAVMLMDLGKPGEMNKVALDRSSFKIMEVALCR